MSGIVVIVGILEESEAMVDCGLWIPARCRIVIGSLALLVALPVLEKEKHLQDYDEVRC